eukprot:CAMPEP_0113667624 /NCGR_PEP_ID=MMETSP0038_2-20120614/3544_1 /TAXON_ID=2898 /ORGANISM="Cryptomonas paramecium" /LENGTH=119 /DNA_ID=CAMNT_0000583269 /DNA_START=8 /DNA_END=364 /DNA_ORIENTATION=- /assembly_acc=CAM_ASM_000170
MVHIKSVLVLSALSWGMCILAEVNDGSNIPPLVTAQSIAKAKQLYQGAPIQFQPGRVNAAPNGHAYGGSSAKFTIVKHSTILADQPSAYAGIPPWVFVLTFLGSVGGIVVMFVIAERMW